MLSRFSPVYSREKQPVHQSHSLYLIPTSVPAITAILLPITVPDTQTIHLTPSTVFATIAAAAVLPAVKQSGV